MGWLWRRTLWQRIGAEARSLSGSDDPEPVWAGWRVRTKRGTVTWRSGLWGPGTRVGGRWYADLLSAEAALEVLGDGS